MTYESSHDFLTRFILSYNTTLAYSDRDKGTSYLRERCFQYNPLEVLQELEAKTQCSAISVKKYLKIKNIVDETEKKINFANISTVAVSFYKTEKQTFDSLKIVDFNRFMENMIAANSVKGDDLKLCWSDIVYSGVGHSRVKFEKFIQMVEYDAVRALNYVTICSDLIHNSDSSAVNSDFTNAKTYIDKMTTNLKKYYDSSMDKAYPDIFKECVKETVGNSAIEKADFNKTAVNLMEKLNRRGWEKYAYHVLVTDLITDGIESAYKCRTGLDCFDMIQSNLRIFVIRYTSGVEVTKNLLDNEAYWIDNEEMFKTKIKEALISDELLPFTDKKLNVFFRDEVTSHFTVIILHNNKWKIEAEDVFFGYDFSQYQGQSMMKHIQRYEHQSVMDDNSIKIFFIF